MVAAVMPKDRKVSVRCTPRTVNDFVPIGEDELPLSNPENIYTTSTNYALSSESAFIEIARTSDAPRRVVFACCEATEGADVITGNANGERTGVAARAASSVNGAGVRHARNDTQASGLTPLMPYGVVFQTEIPRGQT